MPTEFNLQMQKLSMPSLTSSLASCARAKSNFSPERVVNQDSLIDAIQTIQQSSSKLALGGRFK